MTVALIDGDLLKFRCAASAENEEEAWVALARIDSMLDEIVVATVASSWEIWLSGEKNFRYDIYPEYKANRKPERPKWEKDCKDYLLTALNAQVAEGCEADDALGWRAYELGEEAIVVTNDKDLKQIKGKHYDPVKKILFDVSEYEADRFFWYQCLVGDPVDNIKGVPGIGPVRANKILDQVAKDYYSYEEAFPDEENNREPLNIYWQDAVMNEYSCFEEFMMNAKCLWIMREKGVMFGGEKLP